MNTLRWKVISFDLDGTLVRGMDSAALPCVLNGKAAEAAEITAREQRGQLDYAAADYLRADLMAGLPLSALEGAHQGRLHPLAQVRETVAHLQALGARCVLISAGPAPVVALFARLWGFDGYYGTEYGVADGHFTGTVVRYMHPEEKANCLAAFCAELGLTLQDCAAVGDSASDRALFARCGLSVAVNALPQYQALATHALNTDSLSDLLPLLA